MLEFHLSRRIRDPNAFIETESAFESQFKLMNEFSDKYEYKMQGNFEEIKRELIELRRRLEQYMERYPSQINDLLSVNDQA